MAGTILAVEDSDTDFMALRCALHSAGIKNRIERYDNGKAAVQRLLSLDDPKPSNDVSLIVLDLNIPGVNGRQILKEFRARDPGHMVPVIVLTVSTNPRDVDECQQAGANAYVVKPLELEEWETSLGRLAETWLSSRDRQAKPVHLGDTGFVLIDSNSKKLNARNDKLVLARTIEREIIPRLMLAWREERLADGETLVRTFTPGPAEVSELISLLLKHDASVARSYIDTLISQGAPMSGMFVSLLKPAADHIAGLWRADFCETSEYLKYVSRLDELIRRVTSDENLNCCN